MPSDFAMLAPALVGVSAVELAIGGAAGWFLGRSRLAAQHRADQDQSELTSEEGSHEFHGLDERQARELLAQLSALTRGVATHVDEHAAQVRSANDVLSANQAKLPTQVLQAVGSLMQANARMQQQLAEATTKLQEQSSQIEVRLIESRTDSLTGVSNRRGWDGALEQHWDAWRSQPGGVVTVLMDVDHFKKFNDTHGHAAGDSVLRHVGQTLAQVVGKRGSVARYGGEEFAVVLPAPASECAAAICEEIRLAIQQMPVFEEGVELHVTASLGMAQALADEASTACLKRADAALYAAKHAGRNNGHLHDGQTCVPIPPATAPAKTKAPSAASTTGKTESIALKCANPLLDRTTMREVLVKMLSETASRGERLGLAWIGLDQFEELLVSPQEGLAESAMAEVAQLASGFLGDFEFLAKVDDRTLVTIMPGLSVDQVGELAHRLRTAVNSVKSTDAGKALPSLTLSIGVAAYTPGDGVEALLERASEAQRAAALSGGNKVYQPPRRGKLFVPVEPSATAS